MDVNTRIPQAYGYAVCFITVVIMLIAIKSVVDSAFDLADPIHADGGGMGRSGRPLTSFELYKMEARRQAPPTRYQNNPLIVPGPSSARSDTVTSDSELRALYDAERGEVLTSAKFRATKSLVGNLLLIIIAGVLFAIHWRWLRRRDTQSA
jgi:hypothetical protein